MLTVLVNINLNQNIQFFFKFTRNTELDPPLPYKMHHEVLPYPPPIALKSIT